MAYADLSKPKEGIGTGLSSVVIVQYIGGIDGGRTLDMTDFSQEVVRAGHIIIKDANGIHKPMPIKADNTGYAELPANHEYVGVLVEDIRADDPRAGIMDVGKVNKAASPYPVSAAMETALSHIKFTKD